MLIELTVGQSVVRITGLVLLTAVHYIWSSAKWSHSATGTEARDNHASEVN